jgi:proline dehydrogenase
MYLKRSKSALLRDLNAAKEGKYTLAIKLVRGAYMQAEALRADSHKTAESPLFATKQDTDLSYNSAIRDVLSYMKDKESLSQNCALMIASHNRDSIELAKRLMEENEIPRNDNRVGK